ncbi:vacuolar protein sorting-associated protein 8 homolog isoform X2 [Dreissena polymorpha]|uniref:vacuolar protein sorting-associated protein 8 homolog isoform X2 n=1 Tax=Dreissena polymorpha TaxID=45954 RepID=UPI002263D1AA|nr:vacuolar protein sorting-associated protein 8 homolog isoform X2 [Dreissena polymorpha]
MATEGSEETSTSEINFDIEFDESEFQSDLPVISAPPTLESILNEDETASILEEDVISIPSVVQNFKDSQSQDTSSLSSQDSSLTDRPARHLKKKIRRQRAVHGSVLKPSKLQKIAAQLQSAADKVDAGMPTALTVSNLIAIGTSHGLVLVFDPQQVLKWCLGSTAVGSQYGAVSALSFNNDCTRLLSGFARGQITMWDLTNGKLIRTITDAHPPGTAVLHIKFTDSLVLAVCSDSGGSVFELEFKRLIGKRTCESRCLFSGSRGEVCVIEPLHMNVNVTTKDHPMQDVSILAMASLSKVLLVTLSPQLKVVYTHPLTGSPSCLPLLAWQFVIIQVSDSDRVVDPVLVFARESTIYFHQVVCRSAQDIKCTGLQKMTVPYKLLNVTWMNTRTLVTIDTTEKLHVIDVRSEEELQIIDLTEVQMIYNTSFFKSLATGGNVSQALAYAGDHACYQTIASHGNQLFLLGTKAVHVYSVRTWKERIDVLVQEGHYQDALSLAKSFYDNKAKAVVGLTGGTVKKQEIVSDLILELLFEYVDLSMTQLCPDQGHIEELEDYFMNIVPVCVEYCLHLVRLDILFGRIYERFSMDVIAMGTFLECLEPYILDDRLTMMPPGVMKDFVTHYEQKGMLESVEACIVHMDVTSLDIHHVVLLCWSHGLYDAILYVYNKGMLDYITPLEELLSTLRAAVDTGKQLSDQQIRLGNKLLVYISCSLAGRAYPLGDIPDHLVTAVKQDVFKCLTCQRVKSQTSEEPDYPYLRTLIVFDTREFLNVLSLAFEEDEFNTQEGIPKRQHIVDILLRIMVENVGFTPTQVGVLFTFLARQMARHENTITVNKLLFEQVLEFLCNPDDESRHEERQQALLELSHAGGLKQVDEERFLYLTERAKFYRVCELLYEKRRQFDKILLCYLRDYARKYHAFTFISSILDSDLHSPQEKASVQTEALKHLQELVSIDSKQAAKMVVSHLTVELKDVVKQLQGDERVLFQFLQGVMLYRDASGSAINPESQVQVEAAIFELYIDLLCRYRPADVYTFIKVNDGYRLEQTLDICRKHSLSEATAYLLEKAGDVQGAFGIYLQTLSGKLKKLTENLLGSSKEGKDAGGQFGEVEAVLLVIVQLCQRNSNKMDEPSREALWFPLLDALMFPQRRIKDIDNKDILTAFKQLTHHVLNNMMGHIALPAILHKIMQDPAYNSGKFGEIRELILGMLETYNYEQVNVYRTCLLETYNYEQVKVYRTCLLETTNYEQVNVYRTCLLETYNYEQTLMITCKNLLNHDIHQNLRSLTTIATKGYIPRGDQCRICVKKFIHPQDTDLVIVFRCGHTYHSSCLQAVGSLHVLGGEDTYACYLCSHTQRGQVQSTRFHRSLSNPMSTHQLAVRTDKLRDGSQDPEHLQHVDAVRQAMRTPSRLGLLSELSKSGSARSKNLTSSVFQQDRFKLNLGAPCLFSAAK